MGSQRNVAFIALLLAAALLSGGVVGFLTWRQRAEAVATVPPVPERAPSPAPAQTELAPAEVPPTPDPAPAPEVATEVAPGSMAETVEPEPERQTVPSPSPPRRLVLQVGGSLASIDRSVRDGLRVEVGLREAPLTVALRKPVRAERDRYSAELSLPWPVESATLFARIDEPGLQRRIVFAELPEPTAAGTLPGVFFDTLSAAAGSTVLVHVTDPAGESVPRAKVQALHGRGVGDPGGMYPVSTTQDLGQGHFLVHVPPRHPLFLEAELAGVGRAVRELAPEELATERPLELVLAGLGELAGHLLDASGEGIVGLTVSAEPLERVEALEKGAGWVDLHSAEGGGLLEGRATTDAEGRFRIDGLRPGDYVLSVTPALQEGLTVGREVHATGETSIVLRLDLRRIELTVTMEDGRPVTDSWAAGGFPYCVLDGVHLQPLGGSGPSGFAPIQSFAAQPGREYVVGWMAGTFVQERTVPFPMDSGVERVELRLPLRPRLGRARIVVRDPDGRPFEELYRIEVSSLTSGRVLLGQPVDEPASEVELPEGRYALRVEGLGVTSETLSELAVLRNAEGRAGGVSLVGADPALAPQVLDLVIEPDRRLEVEVTLRVGGLVRLLVEGDVAPVEDPNGGPDRLLQGRADWVQPGIRIPLQFRDPRAPQRMSRPFFPATLRSTSTTRLPAGRRTLEVSLFGFETRRVEVDVVEGEEVDVTVKLERL